eukprot:161033-Pelagomonas_calceolata.AAC.3
MKKEGEKGPSWKRACAVQHPLPLQGEHAESPQGTVTWMPQATFRTHAEIDTIQRRLAWLLRKDDSCMDASSKPSGHMLKQTRYREAVFFT